MRRPPLSAAVFATLWFCGCGAQNYTVISPQHESELRASRYVVNATVLNTERVERTNLPFNRTVTLNAVLQVDEVIKGTDVPMTLRFVNYREPTQEERFRLGGAVAFYPGRRLRLGFDGIADNHLKNLRISAR